MRRDNLWFLDEHDTSCAVPALDPMEAGCSHYCVPVKGCEHNKPCVAETSCERMRGLRFRGPDGQEGWHPSAYARMGCNSSMPRASAAAPKNRTAHLRGGKRKG